MPYTGHVPHFDFADSSRVGTRRLLVLRPRPSEVHLPLGPPLSNSIQEKSALASPPSLPSLGRHGEIYAAGGISPHSLPWGVSQGYARFVVQMSKIIISLT